MFAGARRSGWQGRIGFMRGVVLRGTPGTPVMVARSPSVARRLAHFLDGGPIQVEATQGRAPISRYSAFEARAESGVTVVTSDGFPGGRAAFGVGAIATTRDPDLARRLVAILNQVDPAPRPRWSWGWF